MSTELKALQAEYASVTQALALLRRPALTDELRERLHKNPHFSEVANTPEGRALLIDKLEKAKEAGLKRMNELSMAAVKVVNEAKRLEEVKLAQEKHGSLTDEELVAALRDAEAKLEFAMWERRLLAREHQRRNAVNDRKVARAQQAIEDLGPEEREALMQRLQVQAPASSTNVFTPGK